MLIAIGPEPHALGRHFDDLRLRTGVEAFGYELRIHHSRLVLQVHDAHRLLRLHGGQWLAAADQHVAFGAGNRVAMRVVRWIAEGGGQGVRRRGRQVMFHLVGQFVPGQRLVAGLISQIALPQAMGAHHVQRILQACGRQLQAVGPDFNQIAVLHGGQQISGPVFRDLQGARQAVNRGLLLVNRASVQVFQRIFDQDAHGRAARLPPAADQTDLRP